MPQTEPKQPPEQEPEERLPTWDEFKNVVGAMMRASQEENWEKKELIHQQPRRRFVSRSEAELKIFEHRVCRFFRSKLSLPSVTRKKFWPISRNVSFYNRFFLNSRDLSSHNGFFGAFLLPFVS